MNETASAYDVISILETEIEKGDRKAQEVSESLRNLIQSDKHAFVFRDYRKQCPLYYWLANVKGLHQYSGFFPSQNVEEHQL